MRLNLIRYEDYFDPTRVVNNSEFVILKRSAKSKFTDDGIFSEKLFNDEEHYSCKCGEKSGKFYEGLICEKCNTLVEKKEVSDSVAWIDLKHKIIHPLFYNFIKKIVPIDKIIDDKTVLSEEGNILPKEKFESIGLVEFVKNYREILDYFFNNSNKTPVKKETYNFIIEHQDKLFTSKIPIFDKRLRPALLVKRKLTFDKVNNLYNTLLYNVKLLEENSVLNSTTKASVYYNNQKLINEIHEYIIDSLGRKTGLIRRLVLGYRINFSGRSIIVPGPQKSINEVHFPYISFLEMYRFHLINLLTKLRGLSVKEADQCIFDNMLKFDEDFYTNIVEKFVEKSKPAILLNRNPTIDFGSIQYLRITKVKKEIHDYTFSVHNNCLLLWMGDFDGDVLNAIALIDKQFEEVFKKLKPKNFIIDPNTMKFNRKLSLQKDYVLGIWSLLNK